MLPASGGLVSPVFAANRNKAKVVIRIFRMYAAGIGLALISKTLNAEGIMAPQPPRTRSIQAWCPSSIREMFRNQLYQGVRVWNRTVKTRNPETGRKTSNWGANLRRAAP